MGGKRKKEKGREGQDERDWEESEEKTLAKKKRERDKKQNIKTGMTLIAMVH